MHLIVHAVLFNAKFFMCRICFADYAMHECACVCVSLCVYRERKTEMLRAVKA